MSDTDKDKEDAGGCQACAAFEPQAWRKSLCRNCFHSLEEHSEELLAKEAEAVAKEKAEKAAGKAQDSSSKTTDSKKADVGKSKDSSSPAAKDKQGKASDKSAEMDKDKSSKNIKDKFGANKESAKDDGKWSWSKDLGREYGKPTGKLGADSAAVGLKGKSSPTTTASPTSSTTTSSSSSPLSSLKSNLKSATSSSAASTTPTPSTAATTSSTSSSSTATTVSKAKNFASKFESKALTSTKDKPLSKPSDVVHVGPSVAAISGKLGDAPDSKGSSKSPDSKTDSTKSGGSKLDSKTPWKKPEDSKISETASKFSKSSLSKAKDDGKSLESKDNKKNGNDSKEKKSPLGKTEDKDSKFGKSSKATPFGKDMLKSTKDSSKKESSQSELEDSKVKSTKAKEDTLSKTKDSLKQSSPKGSSKDTTNDNEKSNAVSKIGSGKFIFDKTPSKKKEDDPAGKTGGKFKSSDLGQNAHSTEGKSAPGASRSSRDTEQTDAGSVNKTGQLAKSTGKSAEDKTGERPGGKDGGKLSKGTDDVTHKYQNNTGNASPSVDSSNVDRDKNAVYRDRGKEKGGKEGEVARKNEPATLPSSPVGDKLTSTAATSPSPSSKPTTPTTPSSSSSPTDSKTSSPLFSSSKSTAANKKPKDLKLDTRKDLKSPQSPLEKFKGLEKTPDKDKDSPVSSLKSPLSPSSLGSAKEDESKDKGDGKAIAGSPAGAKDASTEKLAAQLKDKEERVAQLSKQLAEMEKQVKTLEEEKEQLKKASMQSQKDDMEKMLQDLRTQLSKMEGQCSRLESDNQTLIDKLHVQEASVKRDQECRGKNSDNTVLEEDLEAAEKELEDVKDENKELQRQIMEMKNEMDEMYDHFRENEHDEFRELQKELDLTAKNCRILQFKLRKAERRNDQIEEDRIHYEEKLRMLQDQFDSRDAKNHIRVLEEELRVAKEVSVRLHDELDIVEDKKNKAMEENRHLTELLEHTDKRQFRMEMEIDKLRDIVADLKQQLKEAKSGNNNNNNNNKDSSPDRKVLSSIYTRSID